MRIALIIGTRPEAIKMAPLYRAFAGCNETQPVLISTGQHRDLLEDTLASLELRPDIDLGLMKEGQTLDGLCAQIHQTLPSVLTDLAPEAVLVQGDTTTAMAAAVCAFHQSIPVGHIEAGLRTFDLSAPFPEEANRQIIDRIARWCFAPTDLAAGNLRSEGILQERIWVTGNTGIDSLLWMISHSGDPLDANPKVDPRKYVLLTLHRRESFGAPLRSILEGVTEFLRNSDDASVIWPVHPNPRVSESLDTLLEDDRVRDRFHPIAPPPYLPFCRLLEDCRLVLTDSGGLQEEGPSLGKRVLVARETTERPEAVESGHNRLVGRAAREVARALATAWKEPPYRGPLPAPNPYGDGQAAHRIVEVLSGAR